MKHHFSHVGFDMLRAGKANELRAGGVWYWLDDEGNYRTVINELDDYKGDRLLLLREFIKIASREKRIFLRKDKPNFPLTSDLDNYYASKMKDYEQRRKAKNSRAHQKS